MNNEFELLDPLLKIQEVARLIGRSRCSIWRDVNAGEFPAPLKNGPRSYAWPLSEIMEWRGKLPRRGPKMVKEEEG